MRRFYFLLSILSLLAVGAGVLFMARELHYAWRGAIREKVRAELLLIRLGDSNATKEISERHSKEVTLRFVGDVMLARWIGYQIEKNKDPRYPFLLASSTLRSADVLFGNLEGPISARGEDGGSIYSFRADPNVVEGLTFAGFDVVSLANNHIWDWGKDAIEDTITFLKENNIGTVGAGRNELEADAPFIVTVEGIRIAFFAYTTLLSKDFEARGIFPGISSFDLQKIKTEVQKIKLSGAADIVVVSLHWGKEYDMKASNEQRAIAHALVDAGADIIVGHHPHVAQEVERYKNGVIAYSLGNFVFDQNFSPETSEGLALVVKWISGKITEIIPHEILFSKTFQPFFKN